MTNITATTDQIHISDYDYHLPENRIARYPLNERDQSKLLIYKNGAIQEKCFSQLPSLLSPEHMLVFNNTKVIPARLHFHKTSGALIEIFCLEPIDPSDYQQAFASHTCIWKCIVGNLKKWKDDVLIKEIIVADKIILLKANRIKNNQSNQTIQFSWDDDSLSFSEIIELAGVTPIPPYLNRESELIDRERYQTVYSRIKGSVAAPTAGLHFTDNILNTFKNQGTGIAELTLHVGAGTFKPVQADSIADHEMHTEYISVTSTTISQLKANHGNLVSIGTTTLRTLESLYWIAIKIKNNEYPEDQLIHLDQWDAYRLAGVISYGEALQILIDYMKERNLEVFFATTQILIAPGYNIRSIEALITNFHQPRSTLLLLVASITGDCWKDIYTYALNHDFRFLSYGDSSLLFLK